MSGRAGASGFALGLALYAGAAAAGITYDASNNCFQVVDYPHSEPATLETLLEADRQAGWGKVDYDPDSDTYTVNAALWVGDRSGYSTCFRIGDGVHTGLVLVMKGSLWVRPAAKGILRADGSPSIMNTLVAGDPSNPAIQPRILFDCKWAGEHGIFAGQPVARTIQDASTLRMYNTRVGARTPGDPARRWGGMHYRRGGPRGELVTTGCYLHEVRLERCRFSDFAGPLFYGVITIQTGRRWQGVFPHPRASIRGCRFENGDAALTSQQYLTGCVFRNLTQILNNTAWLLAYDCTFEGNAYNWLLNGTAARGVTLVDCRVAPQREPFVMAKNSKPRPEQGIPEYPAARLMATLRVRVTDAGGRPVPMASVSVTGTGPIERPEAATGPDGWTGGDPRTDGLVVTVIQYTATDDPERPACVEDFRYDVSATARGKTAAATVRSADLGAPVDLVLK